MNCYTCELIRKRDDGTVPLWDNIHRTGYWDVVHSYNTALPGWMVLIARRHMTAIDEMTAEEASEMGNLIRRISIALKQVTGCMKTYVIQFAEAAEHPHVHFHIVPRMDDQPEDYKSMNIFRYLGVSAEQRVSESTMNEIAAKIRDILATS